MAVTKCLHNDCATMRFESQMKCEIDALRSVRDAQCMYCDQNHSDRQIGYRIGVHDSVSCDSLSMIKQREEWKKDAHDEVDERSREGGGGRSKVGPCGAVETREKICHLIFFID